ncbi:hypothetical protein MTR67_018025 [Solanum verrucosum]|uniref:DUF4283 domain-containing protein n=1 Tax=Solanum verrucosum TaxID=315347 RepID=A0AAF0TSQ1_SOLVR|nr:hypothetical protein MTR67_018025 [Solanum verrucosum]
MSKSLAKRCGRRITEKFRETVPCHPMTQSTKMQKDVQVDDELHQKFADVPMAAMAKALPLKPLTFLHGEPQVIWDYEEVTQMIVNENLEYAVIGKFSYGWPDIQELRRLIPKQCELKGDCNIGLLSNRHVLIRATLLEDYVHLLSKPAFYISHKNWSFPMRTLKWDPMFNPEEETTTAIAWISFPSLPPNFFG